MSAIGYIRQSRRADLDVALSYDSQLAAIHRLAQRDGIDPSDVRILADMGRSGAAGKERLRPAYRELLSAISANGHGTTVYALSMSRLARSLDELRRVYAIAAERGVRIVFDKEGEIAFGSAVGKLHATLVGAVYEFERELAVDRARENVRVRRDRGERMGRLAYGQRPGEDLGAVLAAYREAGSYNGAATLLNDRDVPAWRRTRSPGTIDETRAGRWTGTSVRLVVQREAPELAPEHPRRGVAGKGGVSFVLGGLLTCSCGRRMTGYHHKSGRLVRYKCHGAETDRAHPRPYSVNESAVLPWVMEEAARVRLPESVSTAETSRRRDALEAQRAHVTRLALVPGVDLATVQAQLGAIDSELAGLDVAASVVDVPTIDWTWPTEAVNSVLRTFWSNVVMDEGMTPSRADWRLPPEYLA